MSNAKEPKTRRHDAEDPLNAIPDPPEGYKQVMYTEGRIKELCGWHLIVLYPDGDEEETMPLIIDQRLLPPKIREHGDYVELVIAVRGKVGTP